NSLESPPGPEGRRARSGGPRRRRSRRGPRGCRGRSPLLPARGPCGRRLRRSLPGGVAPGRLGCRALRPEVEANRALLELESGLEGPPRPRREALEQRALAPPEERPRGAGADRLAGDLLPDRELAPVPPAAAAVGPRLLDDLRPAERAGAECRPCPLRIR